MKLTDSERLIVVMLSEVLEGLGTSKELDPKLIKTLAYHGDDWAFSRKYHGLFPNPEPAPQAVTETTNILWMWGIIEDSIKELSGAEAEEASGWRYTGFNGFDGNNDEHYGIAQTMIHTLGEFENFSDRGLNSHSQATLPRYLDIFARFDGYMNEGKANFPLSFDVLKDLCN